MSYGYNPANDDDDLYEGFNYSIDLAPPQTASSKPQNGNYTSGYNNPPPGSSSNRYVSFQNLTNLFSLFIQNTPCRAPPSRIGTGQNGEARPMTSNSGAGFSVRNLPKIVSVLILTNIRVVSTEYRLSSI